MTKKHKLLTVGEHVKLTARTLRRMSNPRHWQPDDPSEQNCMPDDLDGILEVKQTWDDGYSTVQFLGSGMVAVFHANELKRVRKRTTAASVTQTP